MLQLNSPVGSPFSIRITISDSVTDETCQRTFQVQGQDPIDGSNKEVLYYLEQTSHQAYLDFFASLAADFGLRLPYSRQAVAHRHFTAPYRELLGENIDPGILYGYGDPAVMRIDSVEGKTMYYLVVTSNDAPDSLPLLRSPNLTDWETIGYVFPQDRKPSWAANGYGISDYWAPEMHQVGPEIRIYFVARDKDNHDLCIGMARSLHPEGPYQPDAHPILTGNVIDPHVFVADNGTAYLYWKEDNNELWPGRLVGFLYDHPYLVAKLFAKKEDQITASFIVTLWPWAHSLEPMERFLALQVFIEAVSEDFAAFRYRLEKLAETLEPVSQQEINTILHLMKTRVYAQPLTPDGSGVTGERTLIIENDQDWEAHLVEGMWVHRQEQTYYLFYAGNDFSTDKYGIGAATADNPLGPYRKLSEPLLYSTAEWRAPGHPSVVLSPDGTPTLILHAYRPGKAGYKQFRALLSLPLVLKGDTVSF